MTRLKSMNTQNSSNQEEREGQYGLLVDCNASGEMFSRDECYRHLEHYVCICLSFHQPTSIRHTSVDILA
jgi:hypothetical protein